MCTVKVHWPAGVTIFWMTKCVAVILKLCLFFYYMFHPTRVVDVKVMKVCVDLIQNDCLTVMWTCIIDCNKYILIFALCPW